MDKHKEREAAGEADETVNVPGHKLEVYNGNTPLIARVVVFSVWGSPTSIV